MEAVQTLCSSIPSLPLSFHRMGPMGESTAASHVLLLANDKVAATALMNYAGRKGKQLRPRLCKFNFEETEGGKLLGGVC